MIGWKRDLPRLPGTRAMYKVRGCRLCSVGFLGYFGGFEASCVISESELASTKLGVGAMSKRTSRWQVERVLLRFRTRMDLVGGVEKVGDLRREAKSPKWLF